MAKRSFSALSARPFDTQASYFLAGGDTLNKLEVAHEGYTAQHQVLSEIKHDLDAAKVEVRVQRYGGLYKRFASAVEHFDIKFREGDVPQGWRPTLTIEGAHLWLPARGSSDYAYLSRQRSRLADVYATYGREVNYVPPSFESLTQRGQLDHGVSSDFLKIQGKSCQNYTNGWFSWQRDAFLSEDACSLYPDTPLTQRVAAGVFVTSIMEPERTPAGCVPISVYEARMLSADPAKAPARAQIIQDGSVLGRGLQQLRFVLR